MKGGSGCLEGATRTERRDWSQFLTRSTQLLRITTRHGAGCITRRHGAAAAGLAASKDGTGLAASQGGAGLAAAGLAASHDGTGLAAAAHPRDDDELAATLRDEASDR